MVEDILWSISWPVPLYSQVPVLSDHRCHQSVTWATKKVVKVCIGSKIFFKNEVQIYIISPNSRRIWSLNGFLGLIFGSIWRCLPNWNQYVHILVHFECLDIHFASIFLICWAHVPTYNPGPK